MKRASALLLAVALFACGESESPAPGKSEPPGAASTTPVATPETASPPTPAEALPAGPRAWAAPRASASGRPSALLLGIDGAEWEVMDPLIEHGFLPNLSRLVAEGVRADLDCAPAMPETACFCPPVWVSIATGVPHARHGVSTIHHEVAERRARALWQVLHDAGGTSTLVSYRNTWPAEASARYVATEYGLDWMVSQRYERLPKEKPLIRMQLPQGRAKPEDLFEQLGFGPVEGGKRPIWRSVGRDRIAMELLLRLAPRERTDLTVVLLHSPDKAQHLGWAAVQPTPEVPVDPARIVTLAKAWRGPVASKGRNPGTSAVSQYLEVDRWLGRLLAEVPYDTILVASDHGMTRNPDEGLAGEHGPRLPEAHQGVFVLWGQGVRASHGIEDVDVFDVAPTLAHVLGLPVAEDLPGRVLEEAFLPDWLAAHPVERSGSWQAQPNTAGSTSTPTGQ